MPSSTVDPPRAGEHITVPMPAEASLRETVTILAGIERGATSPGEAEAAEWIAARLTSLGVDVTIDEEEARDNFAVPCATLCAAGAAGGLLALAGARRLGGVIAAAAAAGIVDENSNGPRVAR